jgi:hypothetical protein
VFRSAAIRVSSRSQPKHEEPGAKVPAGGALGSQLAAAIIVTSAQAGTGVPAASGYIGALILCAAATCAGAFVACATPRKNPRQPRREAG